MSKNPDEHQDHESAWLATGLAALREELPRLSAPRTLERELRAHLAAHRFSQKKAAWWHTLVGQFLVPALALGCVVAASVPLVSHFLLGSEMSADASAESALLTPFYALASNASATAQSESQSKSQSQGVIVATELPRQVLLDFGLPMDPGLVGQPVKADVLVGAGGEILAVRFSNESGDRK
ncbi:MAG: hypothetical protein ABSF50_09275 [Burkholderiaceae bacterium]